MAKANNGVEVSALTKEYSNGLLAVDHIDLSVAPGEIYGFLGPNGAGKSTTVLMLTTLLPISGGSAAVGGFDVATQGSMVRAIMGAALQDVALDPMLTANEHVRLLGALLGMSVTSYKQRGSELLERVGLTEAADRRTATYSGGMRRRLDLALALLHQPQVLFLDEPTTGLDPQSRKALWDEVARLSREDGVTVFLTTQYLEEADFLADRVGIISKGKIVAEGTPAVLKAEIGSSRVDVTPTNRGDADKIRVALGGLGELLSVHPDKVSVRLVDSSKSIADVVRTLDAAGLSVSDLEMHRPTLDDVFLAKTGQLLEGAAQS